MKDRIDHQYLKCLLDTGANLYVPVHTSIYNEIISLEIGFRHLYILTGTKHALTVHVKVALHLYHFITDLQCNNHVMNYYIIHLLAKKK